MNTDALQKQLAALLALLQQDAPRDPHGERQLSAALLTSLQDALTQIDSQTAYHQQSLTRLERLRQILYPALADARRMLPLP
jgi:hypothetical protein